MESRHKMLAQLLSGKCADLTDSEAQRAAEQEPVGDAQQKSSVIVQIKSSEDREAPIGCIRDIRQQGIDEISLSRHLLRSGA